MRLRGIVFEDFVNYKKPSLFLITSSCDWKCCKEAGIPISVCQNSELMKSEVKEFSDESIYKAYSTNNISRAIVIGGLEPMLQFEELINLIKTFRENGCDDPIIIYTGFNKTEILYQVEQLKMFKNIIIKFGRYVENSNPIYDEVLGVTLASDNQYAEKIS